MLVTLRCSPSDTMFHSVTCLHLLLYRITQKCDGLTDKTLAGAIMEFTGSVKRLIELILDYRNVPTGDGHKNKRMGCMLNLLVCMYVCVCTYVCVCIRA